ncbi:MAG: bifunctional DNA-formamidopyrimidine glycosylase/DNA-(apurinic or apyrimidinic site) lyase, partial [Nitrospinae bacterium]|nr:bifunctional DNA-formamidopyrimidine glycosylase/DNA-(apurinic or apyrimidinic site) lyase [Nitrospinota bacterium]
MPELPEVETLKRALTPLVQKKHLLELKFFRKDLRFPIPRKELRQGLLHQAISQLTRRGKYLLLHAPDGALLLHLGMSGRLIQQPSMKPVEKHTHAIFRFEPNTFLHFVDPRRFGCLLWVPRGQGHPLLDRLGPDPLDTSATTASGMKKAAANCRTASIKTFLMDAHRLAGVGNIYACEALFAARIHPQRPARRITSSQWDRLLSALRKILEQSIAAGGTTLRDFHSIDGSRGYYTLSLSVYGKENLPCPACASPIKRLAQSGRSTFF